MRSVSCCSGTFWLEALLPASWHTELVLVSMLAIGWTPRDDAAEDMAARPGSGPPKSQLEWAARPLRPPVIDLTGAVDDEKHEFMEVYSPPRVAPVLHRRQPGAYLSIDIDTGYDLSRFDVRRTVVQLLQTHRPTFLMLSPPCTMFSKLQNCNRKRVDPACTWILPCYWLACSQRMAGSFASSTPPEHRAGSAQVCRHSWQQGRGRQSLTSAGSTSATP